MTVKDFQIINKIKELYPENEVIDELLRHYSTERPDITLDEATALLSSFNEKLQDKPKSLIQQFRINGINYGIIPDFDLITTAEFLDIKNYETSMDDIHKLLAVLYRPVTQTFDKYYKIEKYQGSKKYADIMKEVDVKVYLSVINFFSALSTKILQKNIDISLVKEQ